MELKTAHPMSDVFEVPNGWVLGKLGDLLSICHGKSQKEVEVADGPYPILATGGQIGTASRPIFSKPSVLIGRKGTINQPQYMDTPFWTVDTLFYSSIFGENSAKFLYYKFLTINWLQFNEASGVPSLNARTIENIHVSYPCPAEQLVIVEALSDVDALIAGLEKLIAKKHDLKQAAMQQLLTGQTRLPGFSGEWVVKCLGDVGECLRGVSYKGDSDLFAHDTYRSKRLLRSNNVQESLVVTSDLQYVKVDRVREHQILREGDVLICMANGSKALVGKAAYFEINDGFEYTFGAFMGAYRGNEQANRRFVFYLFQTGRYRDYITNLLAGSSINNLSPSSIESLDFKFPKLSEQEAIAETLTDMDSELISLESRLAKACELKQGMMQELLTGRIRLV
jgi:type I restriction enzyme S subunit